MFDLAKATLETKNPFWRKRPQLRKRRREFRELNKHYEELLKKTTNIEELIKAVRDQKLTEDANEAKNQIKGIIVEWEELINGLFNIEKTAIIVEFITIDPLEYVGEWVTRVKEQLIALHHEIREKFAGRVDQADMESKFNGMVKDYESAHQTFARIYQKEMSELEKQYRITISQAEGKSDMVRDLQNFMGVVDKRMAISNSLYNERGEVKSVDKDIKEVKDIAAEAAKRLRKEIKDGSVDDLRKSRTC